MSNKTNQILIPAEYKFINQVPEFKDDLPDNAYIDKTVTGCGITTAVLQNNVDYVIAVPFKSLADNKKIQSSFNSIFYPHEIFVFHSDVDYKEDELTEYLQRNKSKPKKIMVTYDSVPKLSNLISFKEYKLFIDEGHKLLEYAGNFKPVVVYKLLDLIYDFKSFVITSATPISDDFTNEKLKQIPKIKLNWIDSVKVNINQIRVNQNQLRDTIISVILKYLRKETSDNIYLFYNSVKNIAKICKDLVTKFGATSDDIKIICADTSENRKTLLTIGKNFKPSKVIEPSEPNKFYKINFITSTAFEGQDFLDPNGRTYIISDSKLEHTKLDISTQVSQIVGRLRDSKYKNEFNMIWTASPTLGYKTEQEYFDYLQKRKESSELCIEDFTKSGSEITQNAIINYVIKDPFFIDLSENDKKELILNPDAINHLMNTFIGTHLQYYVNMNNKDGFIETECIVECTLNEIFAGDTDSTLTIEELNPTDKRKLLKKSNFGKAVKEYYEAKYYIQHKDEQILTDSQFKHYENIILDFETNPDFDCVMEYIDLFGFDQELKDFSDGYLRESNIKKRVEHEYEKRRFIEIAKNQFKIGDRKSNKQFKNDIEKIINYYKLNLKPSISLLNLIYNISQTTITCIENSNKKILNGYEIISLK